MGSCDATEILVALHAETDNGVLVSDDGENVHAKWIGKKLLGSFHKTGKTTRGTDRSGKKVVLPLANLTVPEWLAKKEGFI